MKAPEARYNLARAEALLRELHDHISRAVHATEGTLSNGAKWALVETELLQRRVKNLGEMLRPYEGRDV